MPIKGLSKPPQNLTAEAILSKITEYDIYKFYSPVPFELGRPFSSPLRVDRDPSFVIKVSKDSGYVYHMDFVHPEHAGNSFKFVQQLYAHPDGTNLSYNEALQKIDRDFQLGISPGTVEGDYKAITNKYDQPQEIKLPPFITITPRNFTLEELKYWNDYHIDISELKKYDIYAIDSLYVDFKRITNPMQRLRFAYRYEHEGKELWKIYTPLIKKECGYKWFTNVPIDVMEGMNNIDYTRPLIITKSRKDLIITRKFIENSGAGQNESPVAINPQNIEPLQQSPENVYMFFDNDDPGVAASKFFTDTYNFKYLNIPRKFLDLKGVKDISDLSKTFGLKKCEEFFRIKGLIS